MIMQNPLKQPQKKKHSLPNPVRQVILALPPYVRVVLHAKNPANPANPAKNAKRL